NTQKTLPEKKNNKSSVEKRGVSREREREGGERKVHSGRTNTRSTSPRLSLVALLEIFYRIDLHCRFTSPIFHVLSCNDRFFDFTGSCLRNRVRIRCGCSLSLRGSGYLGAFLYHDI
ncbi:hypothetical protein B296_00041443, partial [Ensete ventricosum]